jgi:predicted RNA-binding Zn ribbon-like protein
LNRLLEQEKCYRQIAADGARLTLVEHSRIDAASELLLRVALQVALLVTGEQPELVKRCAGVDCILWFVDRTKAHRRMFCSAAQCGNRAKVAAFRERERG